MKLIWILSESRGDVGWLLTSFVDGAAGGNFRVLEAAVFSQVRVVAHRDTLQLAAVFDGDMVHDHAVGDLDVLSNNAVVADDGPLH